MRLRAGLVALLLAAAVAGCGGDDDDDNGSSSGGGGNSARPAETILADAGLEVCHTEDEQIAQSTVGPDLQAIRDFDVAKSCNGKTNTPNVIRVFQFSNPQSVQEGADSAASAYPNGVVMISGALVIVVTGPQKDANAEAVGKAYTENTGSPVETTS